MAVPAQWDLTNPAENNGGIWPMPISAFQHFCVKVDVELSADVNQSNNTAQTNFVDLTADCCRPFRFLVGNPFERDITARLVVAPLPKGYSLKLEGGGGEQGDLFVLRPREIRLALAESRGLPASRSCKGRMMLWHRCPCRWTTRLLVVCRHAWPRRTSKCPLRVKSRRGLA